ERGFHVSPPAATSLSLSTLAVTLNKRHGGRRHRHHPCSRAAHLPSPSAPRCRALAQVAGSGGTLVMLSQRDPHRWYPLVQKRPASPGMKKAPTKVSVGAVREGL